MWDWRHWMAVCSCEASLPTAAIVKVELHFECPFLYTFSLVCLWRFAIQQAPCIKLRKRDKVRKMEREKESLENCDKWHTNWLIGFYIFQKFCLLHIHNCTALNAVHSHHIWYFTSLCTLNSAIIVFQIIIWVDLSNAHFVVFLNSLDVTLTQIRNKTASKRIYTRSISYSKHPRDIPRNLYHEFRNINIEIW